MRNFALLIIAMLLAQAHASAVKVSASNSVIASLVQQVGGKQLPVTTIVPAEADAHAFSPSSKAMRSLEDSKLLFVNGFGLEPWLPKLISAIKIPVQTMLPSSSIKPIELADSAHTGKTNYDPHAWWDLKAAIAYSGQIKASLQKIDPTNRSNYESNYNKLEKELMSLDYWAKNQISSIPKAKRIVVSNHDSMGYMARAYGLKIVGVIFPGIGTEREPSAKELAMLAKEVKKSGAKVIFSEYTVNAKLANTLAEETGVKLAPPLYTDALGGSGSSGYTFQKAFKYNIQTIVKALKEAP